MEWNHNGCAKMIANPESGISTFGPHAGLVRLSWNPKAMALHDSTLTKQTSACLQQHNCARLNQTVSLRVQPAHTRYVSQWARTDNASQEAQWPVLAQRDSIMGCAGQSLLINGGMSHLVVLEAQAAVLVQGLIHLLKHLPHLQHSSRESA